MNKTVNSDIAHYFPHTCDIESPTVGSDNSGGVTRTWTSEYTGVAAAKGENKGLEQTLSMEESVYYTHTIVLNGVFEIAADMRVSMEGLYYNIKGVIYDQLGLFTMLRVEFVL